MKRQFQSGPSAAQQADRHPHVVDAPRNPSGFVFGEAPLTAVEAAAYTKKSVAAFRQWARRQGLRTLQLGRSVRFDQRDIDEAMRPTIQVRHAKRIA